MTDKSNRAYRGGNIHRRRTLGREMNHRSWVHEPNGLSRNFGGDAPLGGFKVPFRAASIKKDRDGPKFLNGFGQALPYW